MVSADGTPVTPEDPGDPRGMQPAEVNNPNPKSISAKSGEGSASVAGYMREPENPATKPTPAQNIEKGTASPETATDVKVQQESTKVSPASDPNRTPKRSKKKKRRLPRSQRKINKLVMEFQPDAVEMENRKVAGGLRWTLYVVILLLASTIGWAWWAKVDRVVIAEGKLITTAPTFIINAPQSSPIRSFKVKFGDTIKAGQELITLDPTFSEADVKKLETRLNALNAESSRLEAEQKDGGFDIPDAHKTDPVWLNQQILFIDRERQETAAEEQYEAEKLKLEAQKARNAAEVNSRTDLIEHRSEDLRTSTDLYQKGAGSMDDVRNARIELKYAKNNLITAEKTVAETESQFVVLKKQHEATMAKEKAAISLELAQKRQQREEVEEDLNKARRANEMVVIYAPDDYPEYKVIEIADPTSIANPGQPIVKLLPTNSPLELEVRVQSKDIALIRDSKDGEPRDVRIKISAFPYMKHGSLNGYIKTINEDITELQSPGMTQSYYEVRVRLDDSPEAPKLHDIPEGEDRYLRPGMAATAEIKVGQRRVIDFFVYPLFRSLDTSIREP